MFVEKYLQWMRNITQVECSNGWYEITTPFPDCHNDGIIIYVKEKNESVYLSDDKYFFDELDFSNKASKEEEAREFFQAQDIVVTSDKELQVITDSKLFPIVFYQFVQAISVASKMFIR